MVLYIDACVRKNSRTRRLADCLLNTLNAPYTRLRLEECVFPTVDEAFLEKRDRLLREGDFDNPVFAYARQFAQADEIIIAAPFWDLSFPAVLKSYLEQRLSVYEDRIQLEPQRRRNSGPRFPSRS